MKRIIPVIVFSLLLLFTTRLDGIEVKGASPESLIINVLDSTKADILNSTVNSWGQFEGEFQTLDQLEPIMEQVIESLGLCGIAPAFEDQAESDSSRQIYIVKNDAIDRIFLLKVESFKYDHIVENYVMVDVSQDGSIDGLEEIKSSVEKAIGRISLKPHTNTCVVAALEGRIKESQMEDIRTALMAAPDAHVVEEKDTGILQSISVYSPSISSFAAVRGQKVNLNFAQRYNQQEDRTYLWFSTPLIPPEY